MGLRGPESPKLSSMHSWHALYRAALFENDPLKIPDRILQAERVPMRRARGLFTIPADNIAERRAVDHALYSLSALRDSLKLRKSA